jgi:uncharacterized repeat protein (TIGR01451 family)
MTNTNARRIYKLMVALTLSAVALAAVILALSIQPARAQGEIYVDKQLGRVDPVVHVGEYLTFTIMIQNNTSFTVTNLPLSDTFNSAVLAFADAIPSPDAIDQGAGRLDWDDLTDFFGDLMPGQSILLVVGFIAEHPQVAVVNAAEVHDAQSSGGVLGNATSVHTGTESIGGSSPVDKELLAGLTPQVGQPLTFTIVISNNGFTTMTLAPLVDTYNPAWMAFSYAVPPPDVVDSVGGTLTWNDLTTQLGDVPPHGTLSVMTVFTALMAVDGAINYAEVAGSVDWYGNELGGGGDYVPITIIGAPATSTPTPAPTATPAPRPTQRPTSTSVPAPTPTLVQTPTVIVPLLPQTGQKGVGIVNGVLLVVLFILGAAMAVLIRQGRSTLRK